MDTGSSRQGVNNPYDKKAETKAIANAGRFHICVNTPPYLRYQVHSRTCRLAPDGLDSAWLGVVSD